MKQQKLPVIVAIPNYNMAESLKELLPQVLKQDYDGIYVLDDASTDHSRETVETFGPSIHFVPGKENLGAGGNRNRILQVLKDEVIIHFLDADMRLMSDNIPEIARNLWRDEVGFIGGLVMDSNRRQFFWNYGPRQSLYANLTAKLQSRIERVSQVDLQRGAHLRARWSTILEEWPNPFQKPVARQTFWTTESNFIISSEVFKAIDGYDPLIKNHEVQDLAIRLHRRGLRREFNPSIAALHTAVQVRDGDRRALRNHAEWQIARKHGLHNWVFPGGRFKPKL